MISKVKRSINKAKRIVFKDSVALIKKCGLNLVLFELMYKLGGIAVLYPLLMLSLDFTLRKAGFKYLTNDYLLTYLKSPFTIIFIIIIIVLTCLYISYEVACLSVCFDAAFHGQPIAISTIFRGGIKLMHRTMRKKKINAVFHITAVSLMTNITLLGFMLSNIKIPDAVKYTIVNNKIIFIALLIAVLAFFIYCILHIFIMNYMAYDGDDVSDSKKRSRLLLKHRFLKTFFTLSGWNILIVLIIYLTYIALGLIVTLSVFIMDKADLGMAIYLSAIKIVVNILKAVLVIISVPLSFGVITSLFYRYRCDSGNALNIGDITEALGKKKRINSKRQRVMAFIATIAFLLINTLIIVSTFNNNPFTKVEYFNQTEVMAHRGCSYDAPENTMMAFTHAVESMADYAELDVHETKDGEIIVMHDSSLKRTTGVNRYIWNVTYDEIKDLDAGSWFSDEAEYAECRIPTLREVLIYAKGKIKLNIEIKQNSNEPDLVMKVSELINEYEFQNDCVVTSMNYTALKEIKKCDSSIKTGYVLTVAYGNFYNISDVDAFSINSSFVTKNVVDAIHNRGKEIYVWTVNNKNRAEELTSMGIDALITDNPVMSREVVYKNNSNALLTNVISYVFDR